MKTRIVFYSAFCILTSALAAAAARSAEAPKRADPGSAEDVQDVIFFSDSRPVLLRLHIFADGKPYPARWTEYMTRWFRFLDRDEDGLLDKEEAGRAPSPQMLQQMLSNPYAFNGPGRASFDDLDRDRDNKVSLNEFLRYYRGSSAGPVQLVPLVNNFNPAASQEAITEKLFALLDTDKDGKLSQDELKVAEESLHKYDQNDDELISAQELLPGAVPGFNRFQPRQPGMVQPGNMPLMLVQKEDTPRRIGQRLRQAKEVLARYDKDKNGSLSRDEIGMPKELFDQLDANKDGELDSLELLRWVIATPDAEVVIRMGKVDGKLESVEAMGPANPALKKTSGNTLAFTTDDSTINLMQLPAPPFQQAQQVRQVLVRQFRAVDRANKGYVTKKQVEMPQFAYLRSVLALADVDEDDCLSLEELNGWIDLTTGGMNCQTTVTLAASGRGLFQILDANQDGQLSIRELRNAWTRLSPYDRDHAGSVTRKNIPLQYRIGINPGAANYFFAQPGTIRQPGVAPAPAISARGPLWFRKMDRNGDGDISAREFLGSREDFRRLDTDGDGLISLEEALRADEALRKK